MTDKTSGDRTNYQERGSNTRRVFGSGHGNSYSRGQGRGFNSKKPKDRGKYEALGSGVYSIGYAKQAYT